MRMFSSQTAVNETASFSQWYIGIFGTFHEDLENIPHDCGGSSQHKHREQEGANGISYFVFRLKENCRQLRPSKANGIR